VRELVRTLVRERDLDDVTFARAAKTLGDRVLMDVSRWSATTICSHLLARLAYAAAAGTEPRSREADLAKESFSGAHQSRGTI